MSRVADVAIVGAGISGLTAAYDLCARGFDVRLLEAGPFAGGVMQTQRRDGWVIDLGPDGFLLQKPAALALCTELGLDDQVISTLTPRTVHVLRDGRLHPLAEESLLGFPLSAGALARSSLFTLAGKVRLAAEAVLPAQQWDDEEDESIDRFVRRRFGSEAADYLADPLLAGLHTGDATALSVRQLFPRLVETERAHGSVVRGFRALRPQSSTRGAFTSLAGGVASLVERLVDRLPAGTLTTSAPVGRIDRAASGLHWRVEIGAAALDARALVLAVPAHAAATLLAAFDPAFSAACAEMPYASTATVALGYARTQIAHTMQGTGFVVPRVEGLASLAATWVSSKWPGRAPHGHALVRTLFGGGRDPGCLDRHDDSALVALARNELGPLLDISGDPVVTQVTRWVASSPQYTVGCGRRLRRLDDHLAHHPGLFAVGSGFGAIGIPDCIANARRTAPLIATFLGHPHGRNPADPPRRHRDPAY